MELPTKLTDQLQDFFSRPSSETHINILNGSLKKKIEKKKTSILRLTDNLNAIKPMEKATYTYRTVKNHSLENAGREFSQRGN